jgi:hypothetical protein
MTTPRDRGPAIEAGRGAGVTANDFAALAARRDALAAADMATLGPVQHHATQSAQCAWHNGRVFRYASTPDGARHYCRSCINVIMTAIRKGEDR